MPFGTRPRSRRQTLGARQGPDCVLYGSSAQGGAARKLLKEAATETRPDEKTKGILENFTRQH